MRSIKGWMSCFGLKYLESRINIDSDFDDLVTKKEFFVWLKAFLYTIGE